MKLHAIHKKLLLLTVLLVVTGGIYTTRAQFYAPSDHEASDIYSSLYFELGGNGIIYSINFDLVTENRGLRLGLTPFGITQSQKQPGVYSEPLIEQYTTDAFMAFIMGHYLIGKTAHKFELGGGVLFGDVSHVKWKYPRPPGLTFTAGYRFMPKEKGNLTFRAGFTPIISHGEFHPRIGVSIGWMLTGQEN